MDFPIFCPNPESLMECGSRLAEDLPASSVVALVGGLGMGKTHFTKGLLKGLGSEEVVTSPTFALVQEYQEGRLPVFHFDFYRLEKEEEVLSLGWDDYLEAEGVAVVEWADLFPDLLPKETLWLKIVEKDGGREISTAPRD